ncbi:MAG: hypothetical protein GF344_01690, partial [Chitinivibrionales bacterium]|nr:hypothetical protein [Chitinivibrionales bacterium]MBD3355803.1 hypothetical protein [Chitinivibrionales bacterium]
MWSWLKKIGIAAAIGIVLVVVSGPFIARFLLRFVPHEKTFNEWRIEITDPRVDFFWTFAAEKIVVSSGGTTIKVRNARVDPALFRSFVRWRPMLSVEADSLAVRLKTDGDESRRSPPQDTIRSLSPAFPAIPTVASVNAHVAQTIITQAGDLLAKARSTRLEIRREGALLIVDTISSLTYLQNHRPSLSAQADWHAEDSVGFSVVAKNRGDSISLVSRHPRSNLLKGEVSIGMMVDSMQPYETLLPGPESNLPSFKNISFSGNITMDTATAGSVNLSADAEAFGTQTPYRLSRQKFELDFALNDTGGRWRFVGESAQENYINLRGKLFVQGGTSPASLPTLPRRLETLINGDVGGLTISIGDTFVVAEANISDLRINHQLVNGRIVTADGTAIDMAFAREQTQWNGTAKANVSPTERWFRVFVDTNVTFDSAQITAATRGKGVSATLQANAVHAYGARADTLIAHQILNGERYRLDSAQIINGDSIWNAAGNVSYGGVVGSPAIAFEISAPGRGKAAFSMNGTDSFSIAAESLDFTSLPYPPIDQMHVTDIVVDGAFGWAFTQAKGFVSATVEGDVDNSFITSDLEARWHSDTLWVDSVGVSLDGSLMGGSALIHLGRRDIHELNTLSFQNFLVFEVQTKSLSLRPLAAIGPENVPISGGHINGKLSYASDSGFAGDIE